MAASAVLLTVLMVSSPVQAHVVLIDPVPRTSDNDLRKDPCGGKPTGASVATYTAGTNIEIRIDLSVQHTRSLHAAISYDNFATRTELAMIPTSGSGMYTMTVPLPIHPLGPAVLQVTHGSYVSCADITLSEGEPFVINAGLNDAWYYPGTAGQGFFIIVFPDIQQLFLAWFTFDIERPPDDVGTPFGEPGHRWLTAQGSFEGDTALLDIVVTKGGIFDMSEPEPENSDPGTVGSMEVIFKSCSGGLVKYNIPGLELMGEVPIQRIANDNVALCEAL